MIYEVVDKHSIANLFHGWQESLITSCLQDCMGKAYCDDVHHPQSAMIVVDVFCFFAGKVNDELVQTAYQDKEFMILTPQNEEWQKQIIHICKDKAHKAVRYAIKKEGKIFNKETLVQYVECLPEGYCLKVIDKELYHQVMSQEWSKDLCSVFRDVEEYLSFGLGVVAIKEGEVVSGASSYVYYKQGIEIEIDTRRDERRKGLALACAASLLLLCIERDWYPSWDAQNKNSVALAEKLGYHFDKEYVVYEVYK